MPMNDTVEVHECTAELVSEQVLEADLKRQFLETREALEVNYPEIHTGYLIFRKRYAAFMQSYRRFLGQSTGSGTPNKEAAWKR